MPEIANAFSPSLVRCFSGMESRNINNLVLISCGRVRARHQNVLWIVLLLLDLLQRKTARLPAVISLFRDRETEEFYGTRPFSRCYFAAKTAKTAATGPWLPP
jgi:hypothetical protein